MPESATSFDHPFRRLRPEACEGKRHLGIVLVHGVGFQKPGQTLVAWTDRLARMLGEPSWYDAAPSDRVVRSYVDLTGQYQSLAELDVPPVKDRGEHQHWIMTEAYWAASFEPPSLRTMIAWLGEEGGVKRVAKGLGGNRGLLSKGVFVSAVAAGLLAFYTAARGLLAILPVAALRDAVLRPFDSYLTAWAGDMRVVLREPAQAGSMRKRVTETIASLVSQDCEDIVLLAHSGGAVVSYMTLTDPATTAGLVRKSGPPARMKALISHGQGLNVAWRLLNMQTRAEARLVGERFAEALPAGVHWTDYYATHDPVPAGAVDPPAWLDVQLGGFEVANRHSVREDHGAYWDNDEEFVVPVLQDLERAAQSTPGTSRFAAQSPEAQDARAEAVAARIRRTSILPLWRRLLYTAIVTPVALALLTGGGVLQSIGSAVGDALRRTPGVDILAEPLAALASAATGQHFPVPILAETGRLALMSALLIALAYPVLRVVTPGFWWPGWAGGRRAALIAIDVVAVLVGLLIAVMLGFRGLSDLGWESARYLVVPVLLLMVMTFVLDPDLFTGLNQWPLVSALVTAVTLTVLLALLVASLVAMFAHGAFVIGVLVMLFAYRLLSQAGTWRWAAWDEQARAQFRRELAPGSPKSPRRLGGRFDMVIFVLLFTSAAAASVAFGLGSPLGDELRVVLFTGAGSLLLGACLLSIGQDIANGARLTGTPIQPLQEAS